MTSLDFTFQALSSSVRRELLQKIATGAESVLELAKSFKVSLPAISKHLKVLEKADLIIRIKEGRSYRFTINEIPLSEANQWLEFNKRTWNDRLDSLDSYLNSNK